MIRHLPVISLIIISGKVIMDNKKKDINKIMEELETFDIRVQRQKYDELLYQLKLYLKSIRHMDFPYYQENELVIVEYYGCNGLKKLKAFKSDEEAENFINSPNTIN